MSFVFECVDQEHDPHVIDYPESQLFLLDIINNDMKFSKMSYDELREVADRIGIPAKEKAYTFDSWAEFCGWYYKVTDEKYKYNGRDIEGFVLEDADGYMLKLKLWYYNYWKFLRGVAHETLHKGYLEPTKTSALYDSTSNLFYGWLKKMYLTEQPEQLPKDICTLRKMFYEDLKEKNNEK